MQFERFSVIHRDIQIVGEQRITGPIHIVFAHGWISSRRMWHDVLRALPIEISATAFDYRGCGESDRPIEGHDLRGYADDLQAVIASIPGPVLVAGHSMGARIAQYVAIQAPPNVMGLLLVAPGVACNTVPVPRHRELTARAYGSRRRIHAFQRGAMVRELQSDRLDAIIDDALIAQREHWFGWYDQGRELDFSAELRHVTIPVTVIAGESDPLIPLGRIRREVVDRYKNAKFHVIPNAGHNLAVEAPQELLAHLLESATIVA